MAIYDRTFRRYTGAMTPQATRFLVLTQYDFKDVFKSKLRVFFYALFLFPPLLMALRIYVFSYIMSKDLPEEWHVILDQIRFDGDSVKLLGLYLQCNLAFFMTLLIGPGLVSRDLANNGLPLYLSRPISRAEYVLGRLSVLFVLLSGLTWVPILGLFSLQWILGEETAGAVDLRVAFGMVVGSIVVILLLSTTALALSAWVKWRMLAAFMMLVMFACGWLFSTMINGLFFRRVDTPWGHLINPGRLISIVWSQLLGLDLPAGPPPLLAWAALAALAAALVLVLHVRLRAYEVVS